MIRVDRPAEGPRILRSGRAREAQAELEEFFGSKDARALQSTPRFRTSVYGHGEVRESLEHLFHNKCAFCETVAGWPFVSIDVHFFRPKYGAVNSDGSASREHYWWLVYEWENLYPACVDCNRAAGAKFPVRGRRARIGARGPELEREHAVLLDPCHDDPEAHLVFDEDGHVVPRDGSLRGAATIDTFALNRPGLVKARADTLVHVLARMKNGEEIELSGVAQYAAAVRQVIARTSTAKSRRYVSPSPSDWEAPRLTKTAVKRMVKAEAERRTVPVQVESVELRNFRAIEELDLDFATVAQTAPWTMLLGENGTGKTSILQALAVALAGEEVRNAVVEDAGALVRHGARSGYVRVHVRGALTPIELRFRRGDRGFRSKGEGDPAVLAAYGAGRVPGRRETENPPPTGAPRPRVENLFEPATPLIRPEPWLADLDRKLFNAAAFSLKRVLALDDETLVARRSGNVTLRTPDGPLKLAELSDGYRSMAALATDLMSVMVRRFESLEAAEGIVLIDEIGAHLHPTWQMRIVRAMREAFPRVQFIATTHDPLCLRGVKNNEVVVLGRTTTDDKVYALTGDELPPVEGLAVDQLLTSEHFGLDSTLDPDLERDFQEYYALLAKPRPSARERKRIDVLKGRLDQHRQFGFTRRERLALEEADKYLAESADEADADVRADMKQETRAKIRDIWAEVGL